MGERVAGAIIAGLAGLAFGSFANVVAFRVPRRESVLHPRSRCPSCGAPVAPRDNVPLLSWALLRGRCRACRAPIPVRYPVVEALGGALWALAALRIRPATDLLLFLPLLWVLVPLSLIDLEHKLLPNRIVLPSIPVLLALAAAAAALGPGMGALARAALGGAAGFAAFLAIALVYPAGMGMGDVKFAGLLGIGLGYLGWGRLYVGLFLGFAIGALVSLALVAARRAGRKTQVPFGPSMAAGAAVAVLWGAPLVDAWLGRP